MSIPCSGHGFIGLAGNDQKSRAIEIMPLPDIWCSDISPKHLGQYLGMPETLVQRNSDVGLSRPTEELYNHYLNYLQLIVRQALLSAQTTRINLLKWF